jgi:hypothetical protein
MFGNYVMMFHYEVCMGLVGASHDQHIGRILKKEDEARSTETLRTTELVSSFTSG